jgi:prepilin-type N-terminal cleavage/methylation domain-containing protein
MGMVRTKPHGLGNCAQCGFTLLEVLVAVLILSLAYVAVLQNFSQSSANIFRLGKGMTADLRDGMALERQLRQENPPGEDLVVGQRFVLRKIAIDDGQLETVKVVKR